MAPGVVVSAGTEWLQVTARIDAQNRGTVPNRADLSLNSCARKLVREWASWNAADRGRSALSGFPDVVKKALGGR